MIIQTLLLHQQFGPYAQQKGLADTFLQPSFPSVTATTPFFGTLRSAEKSCDCLFCAVFISTPFSSQQLLLFFSIREVVDHKDEIVVPPGFGCDLKALTVCIIYSSDKITPNLMIIFTFHAVNCTQQREFIICAMQVTMVASHKTNFGWDIYQTTSLMVSLEGEKLVNGYLFGCESISLPYSKVVLHLTDEHGRGVLWSNLRLRRNTTTVLSPSTARKVADIMDRESRVWWKDFLMPLCFSRGDKILLLPIGSATGGDRLIWPWKAITGFKDKRSEMLQFPAHLHSHIVDSTIWKMKATPHILNFMWPAFLALFLQERICLEDISP
ncbi:hypothetical protein DVH24_006795 [Malus domestica]|uniref:Uncharacterized protein n=1 Tax=Malus domestica TaxID=3750 RepID=A0A498J5T0_MALDO|nr:hypothetical protein DVH24_006795 [Malus domestica]